MVATGDTARARMLLAEKGLPQSADSGYDLFNQIGSFGLTSFMQEVTKTGPWKANSPGRSRA